MDDGQSSDKWECSCDIEVCFSSLSIENITSLVSKFPDDGYVIEDKRDLGWGCVIAKDMPWQGDRRAIANLVVDFLSPIRDLISAARASCATLPIVRVGVYYDSFTFTLLLGEKAIEILRELSLELEISMYPST